MEGLGKVDEDSIQFTLLFTTLFLYLSGCKNHVHGATATPEATLTLWKDVVVTDVFGETVENNAAGLVFCLEWRAAISHGDHRKLKTDLHAN